MSSCKNFMQELLLNLGSTAGMGLRPSDPFRRRSLKYLRLLFHTFGTGVATKCGFGAPKRLTCHTGPSRLAMLSLVSFFAARLSNPLVDLSSVCHTSLRFSLGFQTRERPHGGLGVLHQPSPQGFPPPLVLVEQALLHGDRQESPICFGLRRSS